jgi:ubiquinone/menaquinone biosynthesis C-methylase UbiE
MSNQDHWQAVYSTKATDAVSWYQAHAGTSLKFIQATGVNTSAAIIDIGGGASNLVDDLLLQGFNNLSVLDISAAALAVAQERLAQSPELKQKAKTIKWIAADITHMYFIENTIEVWHDRAVFHFLTTLEDRAAYKKLLRQTLKPQGHFIIATFAEDGPSQCSNLPVMRYSAEELFAEFSDDFLLCASTKETHQTPFNTTQNFVYLRLQKK